MCALAKYWLSALTEFTNRGVGDVCIVVCDGLKDLPEAVNAVRSQPPPPSADTATSQPHPTRPHRRPSASPAHRDCYPLITDTVWLNPLAT
jgi:hypothetical protein